MPDFLATYLELNILHYINHDNMKKTVIFVTGLMSVAALLFSQAGSPPKKVAPSRKQSPAVREKTKPVEAIPTIRHAALGAKVVASSTHRGEGDEGEPAVLVDGNLITRWSSAYSAPQRVEIHLPKPKKLSKLRLHWEQACASKYKVAISTDGKDWRNVHLYFNAKVKARNRIDEIRLKNMKTTFIRFDFISGVNTNWGFSLYEIEVLASE